MSSLTTSIKDAWEATEIYRWTRDYQDLPDAVQKLPRHASILHKQAQNTVFAGTAVGFLVGAVLGVVAAILFTVLEKLSALATGWDRAGLTGLLEAYSDGSNSDADVVLLIVLVFFAWCGFIVGKRRAYQISAIATIALSLARIEKQLQTMSCGDIDNTVSPVCVPNPVSD